MHVIVEGESPSLAAIVEREVQVAVFKRITVRPEQMGGIPCIRGLRIPVATVVGMVSEGMAEAEILKACPDLELKTSVKRYDMPQRQSANVSSPLPVVLERCVQQHESERNTQT